MKILKINSVEERGLKQIVAQHRAMKKIVPQLRDCGVTEVYPGAFATALDTVCWYAFGDRPDSPKKNKRQAPE